MKFQISKIILWPQDEAKEKRVIKFNLNKINVITGESHTGKSALVQIIDYCLGSEKCTIPVGIIREKTKWFAIHIIAQDTEILLARKCPENQISTDEMFIDENLNINTDVRPHVNTNRKNVINRLNQIAGFSTERFDTDNNSNQFKSAASFRDTSAFQFQPQHIVANPYTLFYKADTYDHQEKLRTIFPLVIGAVTNEILALERDIKEKSLVYNKLQTELSTKKKSVEAWSNNLKGLLTNAIQLGLLILQPNELEKIETSKSITYLKNLIINFKKNPITLYSEGATENSAITFNDLLEEEREIQNEINLRSIRLSKILRISNATEKYENSINLQESRLEPIGWFKNKLLSKTCPFCGSENDSAANQINSLNNIFETFKDSLKSINENRINLDREITIIKNGITNLEHKLNSCRETLRSMYEQSKEEESKRMSIEKIYNFIGRLEQSLDNVEATEIDSKLDNKIRELSKQLMDLHNKLKVLKESHKLENVLNNISMLMMNYIKMLDIDRPNDQAILDIQNLTLKIVSPNFNRKDFLWEVGSGANWMGYHLSVIFALHEHFNRLANNFVPTFLLIDQPSQVYFPKEVPKPGQSDSEIDSDKVYNDLMQTRKIFVSASEFLKKVNSEFQVIIVEHAPEMTWNDIESVDTIETWTSTNALIPSDW
jgi:energy-coupling factor transporter ATP-binding protein EcfA2